MWQAPQAMPIRNGGSIEPSKSRLSRLSGSLGSSRGASRSPPSRRAVASATSRRRSAGWGTCAAERPGRGAEAADRRGSAAGRSPLRRRGVEGRVPEVAGRVAVAGSVPTKLEEPSSPGHHGSRRSRSSVCAGQPGSPGTQQSGSGIPPQASNRSPLLVGAQDPVPVDRAAEALRVGIGEEAVVEGGREHPDFAPGALLRLVRRVAFGEAWIERTLGAAGLEAAGAQDQEQDRQQEFRSGCGRCRTGSGSSSGRGRSRVGADD